MTYALIALVVLIPFVLGYWLLTSRSSGLPEVWLKAGDTRIRAELALSAVAKTQGLSNRDSLEEGRGMLFSFGRSRVQSFWMLNMRFPIDMVWIDKNVVVGVTPDVDPQIGAKMWELRSYQSPAPADEVLELPAGYAAKHGIEQGTRIIVEQE